MKVAYVTKNRGLVVTVNEVVDTICVAVDRYQRGTRERDRNLSDPMKS